MKFFHFSGIEHSRVVGSNSLVPWLFFVSEPFGRNYRVNCALLDGWCCYSMLIKSRCSSGVECLVLVLVSVLAVASQLLEWPKGEISLVGMFKFIN